MDHAERMRRFADTDLYVVITEAYCAGRSALSVLEAVLDAGVRLVQLREKDCSERELFTRARAFRDMTRAHDALLVIDDRVEIALAVDADGVHLGEFDLPIEAARRIAPELIIGGSSHSLGEALAAQDAGASYVNIGPIFATQTKSVATGAVGPALIDAISPRLRIPFTVMGGIKAHNMEEVLRRGARHVAVVTAVTAAGDIAAAASELRALIRGEPRP